MSPPPRLAAVARFLFLLLLVFVTEALARRRSVVVIEANATMSSENGTFELGFFSPDNGNSHFLGIWYSSVSLPTYIWVANREKPVKNLSTAALEITDSGELAITDTAVKSVTWRSESPGSSSEPNSSLFLFETGNLALVSRKGSIYWQSFDYPADTWLPGMNLTAEKGLLSWRSASDPSPGLYSLRMRPGYGEFELVFNDSEPYWQTGSWTGDSFSNVPEMMVPYIYRFKFDRPYDPTASFGFSERALDNGSGIPLTRFQVESSGLLRQYTWSSQTDSWNMFWSQPAGTCRVFGTCGKFALCGEKLCSCLSGFVPVNAASWDSGDFADGCIRVSGDCGESDDGFEKVGSASFGGSTGEDSSFSSSSQSDCEKACLESCDCVGVYHNKSTNECRKLSGSLMNLRSAENDSEVGFVLARVPKEGVSKKKKKKPNASAALVLTGSVIGCIAALVLVAMAVVLLGRKRRRKGGKKKDEEEEEEAEEGVFPVLSLKVFSYKELQQATNSFSEKVGQGGFGAVFRGKLGDSTEVAVKRLERGRAGSGEKEFRAEVRSIGNIQHVNLVRLLGFCSEDSQRLLVYDLMPNGPLSTYLQGEPSLSLSWERRFRIAVGTAKGIAYLHESCRDRIIHCDIKPENILLDGEFEPRVSDFGLAKLVGRDFSRVMATVRGTWGYVAPEWISGLPITAKADVYSFGMTLFEILAGRRNVRRSDRCWFFPPWAAARIAQGDVAAVLDRSLASGDDGFDPDQAARVGMVAVWCVQDDEAERPDMGNVLKMLQGVIPLSLPPVPTLLQALVSGDSFTNNLDDTPPLRDASFH